MRQRGRAHLLMLTGVLEVGVGLGFLLMPAVPVAYLLGVENASGEALLMTRVLGTALLGIGVGCWVGRRDGGARGQAGLVLCALVYDVGIAAVLVYAAIFRNIIAGPALWPVVGLHSALAAWCLLTLQAKPADKPPFGT